MTLYDTVYLYLKLASEVLSETGVKKEHITNGTFMYQRAKNYKTSTSKYCYFAITVGDLVSIYCCSQLLQAIIMVALWNRADHIYFHPVSSFFFFSSPNLSGQRLDVIVYHTSTHGVALVQI